MKTKNLSLIGMLLLLFCGSAIGQESVTKNGTHKKQSITVSCTPDLFSMTSQWSSKYNSLNTDAKIHVINLNSKDLGKDSDVNLSFITTNSHTGISNTDCWKMVIGRDVIVPFINGGNPNLDVLLKHGISQKKFAEIFNNSQKQNWGTLGAKDQNAAIHIYVVNDESVKVYVAKFLQISQLPVAGITFANSDEVISAIQKDPFAIGFGNVISLLSSENQSIIPNIKLLPIDKNGNGTIDYMEDIYSDANTFLRGVWIGKYPKSLYSNIYAVSKVQPANEAEKAFLTWVLTQGQQYLNQNGYCSLMNSESQASLNEINPLILAVTPANNASTTKSVLLVLAVVAILGLVINFSLRRNRGKTNVIPDFNQYPTGFDESNVIVPNGLFFDKAHTWAFMEKDGNIAVGIDDFLQHMTGTITRVEMKNPGEKIKKGDLLFSIIQMGKQLNLYAPVSGTIKRQNEALVANSSIINKSPYVDGWVYMIEPSNWFHEIQFLEMAEKYKLWITTEFSRIKDFLAATLKPDSLEYSHLVLQDGGVLKDGILSDFGPEVWDDFQTNFLDTYK